MQLIFVSNYCHDFQMSFLHTLCVENSSYRSLDREGDNPMYSPLVEDRYTNIQEGRV